MKIYDFAKFYVHEKKWSVIPLKSISKEPAILWKEFQSRFPTVDELKAWFDSGNNYNIGIVTGKVSGLTVVDLDSSVAVAFANSHGMFSTTPTVKTTKGYHLYFQYHDSFTNKVNLSGLQIDVRGDGGFVVAPPSIHPLGGIYAWE